jgi:hypothetical protein
LTKSYDKDQARYFVEISKKIDDIRKENIFDTIPELTDVLTELAKNGSEI